MRIVKLLILVLFIFINSISINAEIKVIARSVKVEGHFIYYNTAGSGEKTILFLHGLFANKEQWLRMMSFFAENGYCTIALDMPGYGKSNDFPLSSYSIENQVLLLDKFVNEIKLKNFDLAGNSLGCGIAVSYAMRYGNKVKSLALLGGPIGIGKWAKDFTDAYKEGKNPFIPLTAEDFNLEMKLLFYKVPNISEDGIRKKLIDYNENSKKYNQIFNIVNQSLYNYTVDMDISLKKPILVIWGADDKILEAVSSDTIKKKIPGCKYILLRNVGHLIIMENAEKVSKLYLSFLEEINSSDS